MKKRDPSKETKEVKSEPAVTTDKPDRTRVELVTDKGRIVIELRADMAPVTVENFLRYVDEGLYAGTIFHRVIPGFMIQGGGFTTSMQKKPTHQPIVNEASNGLKNLRGTTAMARTSDPHSATAQFFINVNDNDFLNYAKGKTPGYAVFGTVVEGMDVVDAIVSVPTTTMGQFQNVPVQPVLIESAGRVED